MKKRQWISSLRICGLTALTSVRSFTVFAVSCRSESTRCRLGMLMNSRSDWLKSGAEHYRHCYQQMEKTFLPKYEIRRQNLPFWGNLWAKLKFWAPINCRKFSPSVGKLQLAAPYFLNRRRRWYYSWTITTVCVYSHCGLFTWTNCLEQQHGRVLCKLYGNNNDNVIAVPSLLSRRGHASLIL